MAKMDRRKDDKSPAYTSELNLLVKDGKEWGFYQGIREAALIVLWEEDLSPELGKKLFEKIMSLGNKDEAALTLDYSETYFA